MFTRLTNQTTGHRSLLQRSLKVKVTSVSLSLFPASQMSGSCFTTRSESLVRIYANPDKLIQFHLCANLFIRWVLMVVDCLLCEWVLPVPRICHLRKDRIMNDGKGWREKREGRQLNSTWRLSPFHLPTSKLEWGRLRYTLRECLVMYHARLKMCLKLISDSA